MSPEAIDRLGFWFALTPVMVGTVTLVLIAMAYAKATGRRYPFRQFDDPNPHGTEDAEPAERLGLTEAELTAILERYNQSFNLGVEDLARLVGAAELQASTHRTGPLTADDIMSRNLVTVGPDTPLAEVAGLFRKHRFHSLPVVGPDAHYLGVIFQIHLIARTHDHALRAGRGFAQTLQRLIARTREKPLRASDIMAAPVPKAMTDTQIGVLLPMLAGGEVEAVPVLDGARIVGIVTRTDLIAALARERLRSD